jgi:myosin heavy subunit
LKLPQGSDAGFIRKVEKEYKEKSSRFKRDFRMKNEQFEIHHFAGKVLYNATNFLDKNKDKVYEHLEALLTSSRSVRFNEMMQAGGDIIPSTISTGAGGKSSGKHQRQVDTLASRFTGQLHQLITVLQESEPHFVRCIKPNNLKNPISFDTDLVLRQLRYSGVLEVSSCSLCLCLSQNH